MATILVVEDEATILLLVESILQAAGYETLTASTLGQAQAIISSEQKLDLVFTDVQLPDEPDGGLIIGEMVREGRPGTPVIYATARAMTDGMQAQMIEPSGYVPKPYADDKVLEAVSKFLKPTP